MVDVYSCVSMILCENIMKNPWRPKGPCSLGPVKISHEKDGRYRSGTVNSKSFVGKVLLQIKWKFKLN